MTEQQIPTSEVLNRAADLIEERGWQKGDGWCTTRNEGAPVCLEGGLMAAMGIRVDVLSTGALQSLWTCPAYSAVAAYLDRDVTLEDRGYGEASPLEALYWWNDKSTATEVIEVLRAVAVIEAAREEQAAKIEATR